MKKSWTGSHDTGGAETPSRHDADLQNPPRIWQCEERDMVSKSGHHRQTDQECSGPAKSEDTGSSPGDPAQLFLKPSCRWMELGPKWAEECQNCAILQESISKTQSGTGGKRLNGDEDRTQPEVTTTTRDQTPPKRPYLDHRRSTIKYTQVSIFIPKI